MQQALEILAEFSIFSGLEINRMKSEAMWLGSKQNFTDTFFGFVWKRRLKFLGVYFACDKCASQVEEKGTGRVDNILKKIDAWEKRNLSIAGKVCIIKAFLISQFVYIMQALVVPDPVLTQVNTILFRFLWRKKDCNRKAFEKAKRTVVCGALENGGLNMIDLKQMQAAFLLQWVGRLFQAQALDKWSHVPKNIFAPFGDKYLCFFSNLKSRAFKGLQMITSHFWSAVLKTWLDLNYHDPSVPVPALLWNISHIQYQGNALMFTGWITGKILYVKDIKGPSGFIKFQDICNKIGNSPSRILDYNVVRAAVYTCVHSHDVCTQS